jgi:hypothetical protein
MKLSRRQVITQVGAAGAATAAFASQAGLAAQAPGPGSASSAKQQDPQIQLDASLNLDRDDIYQHLCKEVDGSELKIQPVLTDDEAKRYQEVERRIAGVQAFPDPTLKRCELAPSRKCHPREQGILVATRRHYSVIQNKQVVAELDAVVLSEYSVTITTYNVLLIDKAIATTSEAYTQIVKGFTDYQFDQGKGPNPIDHAISRMGNKGKSDEFLVRTAFVVKKVSRLNVYDQQEQFLVKYFKGETKVSFSDTRHYEDMKQYVTSRGVVLHGPEREDCVGRVPPPGDPLREVEFREKRPGETDTQYAAAEDSAAAKAFNNLAASSACDKKKITRERIATIFGWPEFRVVMQDVKIRLGCIWVIFSVPVPQIRFSGLVLFAGAIHDDISHTLETELEGCIYQSAFASAVLGAALGNLAAALAAFQALLYKCVQDKIACIVPELVILVESSSWS